MCVSDGAGSSTMLLHVFGRWHAALFAPADFVVLTELFHCVGESGRAENEAFLSALLGHWTENMRVCYCGTASCFAISLSF